MKQIFVGSTQRSSLYTEIKKVLRILNIVLIVTLVLLIVVPITFARKLFSFCDGNMSPVALVITDNGTGSATYIGNNHMLTAAHVLSGLNCGDKCLIVFNSSDDENTKPVRVYAEIEVLGNENSINEDYALLHILGDPSKLAKALNLGDATSAKTRDEVYAIGYPDGVYSATKGIISNAKGGQSENNDIFMVDATCNPGNSGGALVNVNNQIIGVVIAKHITNDNQAYAIKINKIKKDLQTIHYTQIP